MSRLISNRIGAGTTRRPGGRCKKERLRGRADSTLQSRVGTNMCGCSLLDKEGDCGSDLTRFPEFAVNVLRWFFSVSLIAKTTRLVKKFTVMCSSEVEFECCYESP